MYKEAVVRFRLKLKHGAPTKRELTAALKAYVDDAIYTQQGGLRPPGAYSETDEGDFMFANVANITGILVIPVKRGK